MRWIKFSRPYRCALKNERRIIRRSVSSAAAAKEPEPFYGLPRPPHNPSRLELTLQHAITALRDPTRADAVAAVGELTGAVAIQKIHRQMIQHPVGKQILLERPIVSKATIPFETLMAQQLPSEKPTFGQAYGAYLREHDFDPDARDPVRYFDPDSDEAYIVTRYRQCHDFWHALTGLPPTVPGELGLKWLELFQTGLPVAAMSCTTAVWTLPREEQSLVWNVYLPWARQVHKNIESKGTPLLYVYYEKEWDTPLDELQNRIGIEPAPIL